MKLVEIAKGKIRDELKSTKGAIMYDGWTENGVHYVGIYVVYNRTFGLYRNGVLETESELAITLLSVRHFEDVFLHSSTSRFTNGYCARLPTSVPPTHASPI